jgi:hypothetical protein
MRGLAAVTTGVSGFSPVPGTVSFLHAPCKIRPVRRASNQVELRFICFLIKKANTGFYTCISLLCLEKELCLLKRGAHKIYAYRVLEKNYLMGIDFDFVRIASFSNWL